MTEHGDDLKRKVTSMLKVFNRTHCDGVYADNDGDVADVDEEARDRMKQSTIQYLDDVLVDSRLLEKSKNGGINVFLKHALTSKLIEAHQDVIACYCSVKILSTAPKRVVSALLSPFEIARARPGVIHFI